MNSFLFEGLKAALQMTWYDQSQLLISVHVMLTSLSRSYDSRRLQYSYFTRSICFVFVFVYVPGLDMNNGYDIASPDMQFW